MATRVNALLRGFFTDGHGHVVLVQWPNSPLIGGVVFKSLSLVLADGSLRSGCGQIGTALFFTWAYLEATEGVNYFRKCVGLIVVITIAANFLKNG